ncbi:MAG: ATP-binding cassette domain-containing protein [Clostridia bacterium]|nr:ATP-binding cassette domain-containing protein [Clostridia bacterium]
MIKIENLSKTFHTADGSVEALKNVSLDIADGDIFGIIGMSGAGKSTLVRCINLLERPDEGTVTIDGTDLGELNKKQLRFLRREVTMIFQGFHLLMQRTCLKNVCFPLELAGYSRQDAQKRAKELLETVGLLDKANAYPSQLSGGQQQRVAIARALATNPKVLLCDEATSALDPTTTNSILELIQEINQKTGITVVVITHQMSVVEKICRHVAILDGGEVAEQGEVTEVFSHPRSEAAKRLVYPASDAPDVSGVSGRLIRIVFNGAEAANTPIIARMASERGIAASIVYASTKSIGGKAYGQMLLALPDNDSVVTAAIGFLTEIKGILAEEVNGVD